MIKVLLERTIRGKHVKEAVTLMRQMRVMAMQQPGYVSGETLHAVDDPNHYLVISSWESLEHWQSWFNNPERQRLQKEVDEYLGAPVIIRVFTYQAPWLREAMSGTLESRTISVSIDRPVEVVYNFASKPENLPKWASGLGKSITKMNGGWLVETPQGPVKIRFTERNEFGVLDHYVTPVSGPEIYCPMRVVANGPGSELTFTLFRLPQMSDEKFAADADWVRRDLNTLKALLEAE